MKNSLTATILCMSVLPPRTNRIGSMYQNGDALTTTRLLIQDLPFA